MSHVVAGVLVLAGALVCVAAAVGALLVRTALARMHFVTPVTSVAGPLIGLGLAFENGWGTTTGEVLLAVALLAVTGPVLEAATGRLVQRRTEPGG